MLAGGFLVLAGGVAGFLFGRWTASSPTSAAPAPPAQVGTDAPDLGPVLTELERTRGEILRAVREQRRPQSEDSDRESALPDDRLDRLTSSMKEMEGRLEEQSRSAGRGRGHSTLGQLQDSIRRRFQMIEAGLATHESLPAELRAGHALWTQQELIARYGTPSNLSDEGEGKTVWYEIGDPPGGWVRFYLVDDKTMDVTVIGDPRPR